MAREMLKNILEILDKKLAEERDKSKYKHGGGREAIRSMFNMRSFSDLVYR